MKRLLLAILLILGVASSAQTVWTVETVPNTRLQNDSIHVSDPDGFLSDSAEMNINMALCAIREQADVFVVTLATIGEADPKHFATTLFNTWGIGDAETNNGVLLLFVEDQHALEFETGYGAEEILTDAQCQRIFTKTIVPFFKAGDYEGGLCAGIGQIVEVYGGAVPDGLITVLPEQDADESDSSSDFTFWFGLVVLLTFFIPVVSFFRWLFHIKDKKRLGTYWEKSEQYEEDGISYVSDYQNTWSGSPWEGQGCLRAMTFGHSLLVLFTVFFVWLMGKETESRALYNMAALGIWGTYTTVICFFQNMRSLRIAKRLSKKSLCPKAVYKAAKGNFLTQFTWVLAPWLGFIFYLVFRRKMNKSVDYCCPTCGSQMETDSSFQLPEIRSLENRLMAVKYTPYLCTSGHHFVMKGKGEKASDFKVCDQCGAFTLNRISTVTKVKADTITGGVEEETYLCQNCGYSKVITVRTPKIYVPTSSSSSSSSSSSRRSSSSHSSSRSSGGSFGGGRSGGGGYSGRW